MDIKLPWYLDFWTSTTENMTTNFSAGANDTLSPQVERIITAYLPLREISSALSKQVLKIQDTTPALLPSETDAVLGKCDTLT